MYKQKSFLFLIIITVICCIPGFLFAGPDYFLGLTGGLNRSQLAYDANYSTFGTFDHAALHFNGGLSMLVQYDHWGIESGIRYNRSGAKTESMIGTTETGEIQGKFWITQQQSHIEVPLLATYSFQSGNLRPYIFAGPNFRFLLDSEEKLDSDYGQENSLRNIGNYMNNVHIALETGAGVRYAISPDLAMGVSASYLYGLNNQLSNSEYGEQKSRDFRINFSLYYLL